MTVIKKTLDLSISIEQMFSVVTAIEEYPQFLNWCRGAHIHNKSPNKITATVNGEKLGISFNVNIIYSFQSHQMIEVHLSPSGPFQYIRANWRFEPSNVGSKVTFELQYEFTKKFLNWTLTPLIKNEVNKMVSEFSERAKVKFGK